MLRSGNTQLASKRQMGTECFLKKSASSFCQATNKDGRKKKSTVLSHSAAPAGSLRSPQDTQPMLSSRSTWQHRGPSAQLQLGAAPPETLVLCGHPGRAAAGSSCSWDVAQPSVSPGDGCRDKGTSCPTWLKILPKPRYQQPGVSRVGALTVLIFAGLSLVVLLSCLEGTEHLGTAEGVGLLLCTQQSRWSRAHEPAFQLPPPADKDQELKGIH